MQCIQNHKNNVSERQPISIFNSINPRESRPVLKCEYVRKIAADACMVGSLPTPQSSRVPPGLIRSTEFYNCTYTTNSGFGGMRTYPYSDYRLCKCISHTFLIELFDCGILLGNGCLICSKCMGKASCQAIFYKILIQSKCRPSKNRVSGYFMCQNMG